MNNKNLGNISMKILGKADFNKTIIAIIDVQLYTHDKVLQ